MEPEKSAEPRRQKELFRQALSDDEANRHAGLSQAGFGKVAERLRRIPAYQAAQHIMVSPGATLHQVRLNVLTDRKQLIMPTPGLQKGFILLDPNSIPYQKRSFSVRVTDGSPFARKIPYAKPIEHPIDFIVTDAIAAGRDGTLLGDGHGHLDIQFAILGTLGWLATDINIAVIVGEERIYDSLPVEETDVCAHLIITPLNHYVTSCKTAPGRGIIWESLTMRDIRRNDALFYIHGKIRPESL